MTGIMEEAQRRRRMRAGVHLHKKQAIQDTGHTKQILAREVDRRLLDEAHGNLKVGIQFTNECYVRYGAVDYDVTMLIEMSTMLVYSFPR